MILLNAVATSIFHARARTMKTAHVTIGITKVRKTQLFDPGATDKELLRIDELVPSVNTRMMVTICFITGYSRWRL